MTAKYQEVYRKSIKNPQEFWSEISKDIFWYKKPSKILNSNSPPFYKWYEDGVTNTCYNALDVHIDKGRGDRTALIYDSPITGNKSKFGNKTSISMSRYILSLVIIVHIEGIIVITLKCKLAYVTL